MSNLSKALERVSLAIDELRRSFGELLTETEIADRSAKQLRKDLSEAEKREGELRDLLREKGLASYDDDDNGPEFKLI